MVQRYDSRRKPIYKNAPWYQRNTRSLLIAGWAATLGLFFGPWLYAIIWPSQTVKLHALDPRNEDDLKKLKDKLAQRERELCSSPYDTMFK